MFGICSFLITYSNEMAVSQRILMYFKYSKLFSKTVLQFILQNYWDKIRGCFANRFKSS